MMPLQLLVTTCDYQSNAWFAIDIDVEILFEKLHRITQFTHAPLTLLDDVLAAVANDLWLSNKCMVRN
jgi:hypothetical protein